MREPGKIVDAKDRLSGMRFSSSAEKIITRAFRSTNPHYSLKLLIQLSKLGKGFIVQPDVAKYSCLTGKAIRYSWQPIKKWDWVLGFDKHLPKLEKSQPLYQPLLKILPEGKAIILKIDKHQFTAWHSPSVHTPWDEGYNPHHIKFIKIK